MLDNSWDTLVEIQEGETIELEGFLSQTTDGKWLLSPISNCCRKSEERQVILLNNTLSHHKSNAFLKVRGTLQNIETYTLADVEIIGEEQQGFPTITLIALLVGVASFWLLRRFKRS